MNTKSKDAAICCEETKKSNGAFKSSLIRSNKELKSSRAESIAEGTQLYLENKVRGLVVDIKRLAREQNDSVLNLSPTNIMSNNIGEKFNLEEFAEADFNTSLEIRRKSVNLKIALERLEYFFGKYENRYDVIAILKPQNLI